jgi:hypothetical protein
MSKKDDESLLTRFIVRAIEVVGDALKDTINRKVQKSADEINDGVHELFENLRGKPKS